MTTRRHFIRGTSAAGVLGLGLVPSFAQNRSDTVRLVIGFAPGGTADAIARRVADRLRGQLAANVVVENKVGAGGQIAITNVKDSPGDGNTILMTPSSCLSVYPFTYPNKLPYKVTDLAPISTVGFFDYGFGVGPAVPESVKTMSQFLAWTKANPEKGSYGSPAPGSMPHMIVAYIAKLHNLPWTHIPYRGAAPGIQDLLGGQISAMSASIGDFLPHVKTGRLRVLAVSSATKNRFAPEIPSYRTQGIPIAMKEWYGLFLPSSASASTQRRIAAYTQAALTHPDIVSSMNSVALDVKPSTPDEVSALLRADSEEWRRLIKLIGFNAES
jgi:tripartite-type tricarboxylate transporter receptor subunit TctC